MPWLETYNPKINWKTKTIKIDEPMHRHNHPISTEEVVINRMKLKKDNTQEACLEDEDFVLAVMSQEDSWIRAKLLANYYEDLFEGYAQEEAWVCVKQTHSQKFAQEAESKKDTGKTIELPKEYKQFVSVFGKQESTRLPAH